MHKKSKKSRKNGGGLFRQDIILDDTDLNNEKTKIWEIWKADHDKRGAQANDLYGGAWWGRMNPMIYIAIHRSNIKKLVSASISIGKIATYSATILAAAGLGRPGQAGSDALNQAARKALVYLLNKNSNYPRDFLIKYQDVWNDVNQRNEVARLFDIYSNNFSKKSKKWEESEKTVLPEDLDFPGLGIFKESEKHRKLQSYPGLQSRPGGKKSKNNKKTKKSKTRKSKTRKSKK